MNKQDALKLALEYAAQGIPAFPVAIGWDTEKGKASKSTLRGSHAHHDATTDTDALTELFGQAKVGGDGLGVGLLPGAAGYIVIDVDAPDALDRLEQELPPTLVAETATEGHTQRWYKKPEGLGSVGNGNSLGDDIDVRSDNGWVVAPGTVCELHRHNKRVSWEWISEGEPVELPRWVESYLSGGSGSKDHWKELDRDQVEPGDLEMLELMESEELGGHHAVWNSSGYITIKRPGAEGGASASIGHINVGVVKVFSSGWKLPDGRMLPGDSVWNVDELKDFLAGKVKEVKTLGKVSKSRSVLDRLASLEDIENLKPPEFLIDGYLVRDTFAILFADREVGKSFLAIDWAMHIATGRDWQGKAIKKPEPVLYVVGEGTAGFGKRTKGWRQHHEVDEVRDVHVIKGAVNLFDADQIKELVQVVDAIKPGLIVFDTLARCMVGAEENSATDVGKVVANLDIVREVCGSTVLAIHHTGHSSKERFRGSSALGGAVDTELALVGNGTLTLKTTKQKDFEHADDMSLVREKIYLEDGQSTCVIIAGVKTLPEDVQEHVQKDSPLGRGVQALRDMHNEEGVKITEWMEAAGYKARSYFEKQVVHPAVKMGAVKEEKKPGYATLYWPIIQTGKVVHRVNFTQKEAR